MGREREGGGLKRYNNVRRNSNNQFNKIMEIIVSR